MKTTFSLSAFIILLFALASQAVGQTAITTLENEDGETVLKSFDDGGFLLLGEHDFGAESIPIEGGGARLMWYPGKAAFRVGYVSDQQWDEENIGRFSIAMGDATIASAQNSTAIGLGTRAIGNWSTALGSFSSASGNHSIAIGNRVAAEGNESTAMGSFTTASGVQSTTMGRGTVSATTNSLSIGVYNDSNRTDDGTLFVAGNGSFSNRSDALRLSTGGNLTIAGTLTQNSDRRLKTNIEPIGGGTLAKLGAIEPVRYQFKNQQTHPEGTQIGLIAQQVQEQFPELVSKNSSGYLSLSYSNLSTVLLKGIQEQQVQIIALKNENRTINEHLRIKSERVDKLEQRLIAIEQPVADQHAAVSWHIPLMLVGIIIMGGLLRKRPGTHKF